MKKLIIYHGSTQIIKNPKLSVGRKNNDYGQGFYCTEDVELAKEWACKFDEPGYVNKYELDISGLNIISINDLPNNVLIWISLLLKYRVFNKTDNENEICQLLIEKYSLDLSDYDVVIGYRADDSYFAYAQRFIQNRISLENLSKALKFGSLGNQVALISEKAFKNLKYIETIKTDNNDYYFRYIARDNDARKQFNQLIRLSSLSEGTYVIDIIREQKK